MSPPVFHICVNNFFLTVSSPDVLPRGLNMCEKFVFIYVFHTCVNDLFLSVSSTDVLTSCSTRVWMICFYLCLVLMFLTPDLNMWRSFSYSLFSLFSYIKIVLKEHVRILVVPGYFVAEVSYVHRSEGRSRTSELQTMMKICRNMRNIERQRLYRKDESVRL